VIRKQKKVAYRISTAILTVYHIFLIRININTCKIRTLLSYKILYYLEPLLC